MRYKNNVGPQVRRRRYSLGWSQSTLAAKLQIAGFDISRSGVSKIEACLSYVDDKSLLYLAEVLKVPVQDLFPARPPGNRIYDFMERLETILSPRFWLACGRNFYTPFLYGRPKNWQKTANQSKC
jgi:HTH-type transcriptional regulator, cell division transcriptional repressor